MLEFSHPHRAFYGRSDLHGFCLSKVRGRTLGPLPAARLSEIFHAVAASDPAQSPDDASLGWPHTLLALVDALVRTQPSRDGGIFLETLLRTSPPGTDLGPHAARFLLRLLDDPGEGVRALAPDGVQALLGQFAAVLEQGLDAGKADQASLAACLQRADLLIVNHARERHHAARHYAALVVRAGAEGNVAAAARWAWHVAAYSDQVEPSSAGNAADRSRHWQVGVLVAVFADAQETAAVSV